MTRKLAGLLALCMLMALLAACGGNGANKPTNEGNTPSTTAPAKDKDQPSGEKKVIKMLGWKQSTNNTVIESINKKFEEKYPEYKVEYVTTAPDDEYKQAYKTRVPAGEVDIFADLSAMRLSPSDWTPGAKVPDWQQFIDNGLIQDLSDQAFIKNYNEADIKDGGTYQDKVYAIPAGKVAMGGLFYNKDIFAKYDLKVPTTWSEFINVNEVLLQNNVTPIAMAGKDKWPVKLAAMNLQAQLLADGNQSEFIEGLWKGTSKFNDPDAIEVLEKMKTIQDKYTINGFMGIDYGTLTSYFTGEKVAMMVNGVWEAGAVQAAKPDMNFGYFPLPATDDPARIKLIGKYDMTWYVTNNGGNTEGAIKWLEFFSQPEIYQEFVQATGFLPVQPNIATTEFLDAEVQPYMNNFEVAYEIKMINRDNIGQHLEAEGIHTEYLAPGGEFKTAKELADVQQKEWEAAAPK